MDSNGQVGGGGANGWLICLYAPCLNFGYAFLNKAQTSTGVRNIISLQVAIIV